ncbi:ArsR/SmtB family transcription factor [Leucobacter albus]|uniref:ArsR/SmtB family transcription factor n=1 Tax=Leucobacter albus TaxID=272210 RepID=A0ABW3TPA7_9MICO
MVALKDLSDEAVDRVFRALADATRRDIMRRTLASELSVTELAGDYDMSFAAVQKHVAVLEAADLVAKIPRGRERIVSANPETIRRAGELLGHFEMLWRGRIDRLDALLTENIEP